MDNPAQMIAKCELIAKLILLGIAGTIVGTGIGAGATYFIMRDSVRIERKDLNNDGIIDMRIEQKGRTPEYFISNRNGRYEHGFLDVSKGFPALNMDNGEAYLFGEKGLQKATIGFPGSK